MAACAIAIAGAASAALPQRTFVGSTGLDTNPCTIVQPCRSFAVAITHTATDGEVIVLDSAGYGPVTITQPVSLIAPAGVYAGISVPAGQDGITVSAGASDRVILRGLTINGQGGNVGIRIVSAEEIHVESCVVSHMAQEGIRIEGGTTVHIVDTTVRSNSTGLLATSAIGTLVHARDSRFVRNMSQGVEIDTGNFVGSGLTIEQTGSVGMFVFLSSPGTVTASLANSVLEGNTWGFVAYSNVAGGIVRAAAKHVTSSRNSAAGFESNAQNAADVVLTVTDSASVGNGGSGITAIQGATTVVSYAASSGNTGADLFQDTGGIMRTSGNNALTGRGPPDISGVVTPNPLR